MDVSAANSDVYRSNFSLSSNNNSSRRYPNASSFFRAPVSSLLEYSGILRTRPNHSESNHSFINNGGISVGDFPDPSITTATAAATGNGEVSIRIIEQDHNHSQFGNSRETNGIGTIGRTASATSVSSTSALADTSESIDGVANIGNNSNNNSSNSSSRDSPYQRYDIQQAARWIEQVLPFSLLLLIVFIRQHLQGFFVIIWIAAVMFKSNDILRKQTALKGERKISILVGISFVFMLHVVGVYWWYRNDDLLYPLAMIPPKAMPPFWHAIFIIMVNDTLVRQASMVLKSILLMYYKNSRGRNYRRQGQMLTLVEYMLLLYRALLPAPVWYRFFLNKEYGSLFSSLMTGLYLTLKLTTIVEKVQSFFAALKALSRKDINYGTHATSEQVLAAGDLCAICQEKMHIPILLRCKHIFCEDCVSEWFERERTCPLCRALVKPSDLRSFGDGSTSLFFQFF